MTDTPAPINAATKAPTLSRREQRPTHVAADLQARAAAKRARRAAKPDASRYARANVR